MVTSAIPIILLILIGSLFVQTLFMLTGRFCPQLTNTESHSLQSYIIYLIPNHLLTWHRLLIKLQAMTVVGGDIGLRCYIFGSCTLKENDLQKHKKLWKYWKYPVILTLKLWLSEKIYINCSRFSNYGIDNSYWIWQEKHSLCWLYIIGINTAAAREK